MMYPHRNPNGVTEPPPEPVEPPPPTPPKKQEERKAGLALIKVVGVVAVFGLGMWIGRASVEV